ncbi:MULTISPECIES: NfeD family protein [unclassified Streptomyces]|uniref:NfeD family protein n=1 Tax=unclassified Streptomyces TaxID=2593676 RepID=UPI0022B01578|nr:MULTISPECIES: NfeD family protein [unclassified Streptomyces]MCZ4119234.1 NfeD family protein [Streptomyces sp. H39-S7]MDF9816651.1 membrane protein implicated in regulation of membrane protease activity [Streptomyces sp. SPB162]
MDPWLIWLITAAVLGVAEIFTLTAALGILGVAALVTAGAAALGLSAPLQFVVFTVVATLSVLFVRPFAVRRLAGPPTERFGIDALVGQTARTLSEVTDLDGRVRIGGEEWTARCFDDTQVIPPGTTVDVMEISGTTAFVYPRE